MRPAGLPGGALLFQQRGTERVGLTRPDVMCCGGCGRACTLAAGATRSAQAPRRAHGFVHASATCRQPSWPLVGELDPGQQSLGRVGRNRGFLTFSPSGLGRPGPTGRHVCRQARGTCTRHPGREQSGSLKPCRCFHALSCAHRGGGLPGPAGALGCRPCWTMRCRSRGRHKPSSQRPDCDIAGRCRMRRHLLLLGWLSITGASSRLLPEAPMRSCWVGRQAGHKQCRTRSTTAEWIG